MWDKLMLNDKDYEILTKGIAGGVFAGTIIGIITGEITLFFALGGVIGIVASTIISISNKFIKE